MAHTTAPITLFIDTDMGVDDAIAVAWLLREPCANIVGFSTVSGNATVAHVTANLLTLLDTAGVQIPVTIGATAPLVLPYYYAGLFVHGSDGFWGAQSPHDLSALPRDVPAAIAAAVRATPGLTILALGPLTNLAHAVQRYPQELAGTRLVVLGGAMHGGNSSPVAEFNIFWDPHALEVVLSSQMQVELVTMEAFGCLQVESEHFVAQLERTGDQVGKLLARILMPYAMATTQGVGGAISIPDAAAAIYTLRPDLGTATPALVSVITEDGLTRGQTIVADTFARRITTIASASELSDLAREVGAPNFDLPAAMANILQRRLDNAHVVLQVEGIEMARLLIQTLTAQGEQVRAVGGAIP